MAGDDGLDLTLRSELDPRRAKAHPGFFSAFPSFEPTSRLAARGLARLRRDRRSRQDAAVAARSRQRAQEPGLAAAVGDLVKRVKKLGRASISRGDLLPSLGGEARASRSQPASDAAPAVPFAPS